MCNIWKEIIAPNKYVEEKKQQRKRHLLRWWSAAASFNRGQFCHFILFERLQKLGRQQSSQSTPRIGECHHICKVKPCIFLRGYYSPRISQGNSSSASSCWYYSTDKNKTTRFSMEILFSTYSSINMLLGYKKK